MIKRKGQIVPRWLVKSKNKFSHTVRFGCDVEICGRKIKALSEGSVIELTKAYVGGKNKPKCYVKGVVIDDLHVIVFSCGSALTVFK